LSHNRSCALVRERRQAARLSRAALARKLGIRAGTLANIEAGLYRPSADVVVRMLLVLGLTGDRSERVEQFRCLAVELPAGELDRLVLEAAQAGGDFEDIQSVIYQAKRAWMEAHGTPESLLTADCNSGRMQP
jgi:transcriptional regulator with XRE-family HTH domain